MRIEDLISTYSYAGDIISAIICFVLLVLIRQALFFTTENDFRQVSKTIRIVMIAALANIAFALVITYMPESTAFVFLTRNVYHSCLLWALFLFTIYITKLVGFPPNKFNTLRDVMGVIVNIGIFADILSPVTKIGFYESDGLWYDSTYVKPFTVTYIICMLFIAYMLLGYRRRLIKQLRITFIIVELIVAVVMIAENAADSNTYTTSTFLIPIIAILILVHSKPFDLVTGSMDKSALASFIQHTGKRGYEVDYVILEIRLDDLREMPEGLGRILYSTWQTYFKSALLFNYDKGMYVMAIRRRGASDAAKARLYSLVQEELPIYYRDYMLDYKILALHNVDFVKNLDQLKDIMTYALGKMDYNTSRIATEDEIERYSKMEYIVEQLQDIVEKGDLNDPRVRVYCQPVKNMHTGAFDTAEALMRIEIPKYGMVYPDVFIRIAEQKEFIHSLSQIIVHKTCKAMNQILADGYKIDRMSINFSLDELREPNFCNNILDIIHKNNIPESKIAIELTEGQSDSDYEIVHDRISVLKKYGIKFYLDDFGTGYSNFERVMKLGMDVVKIDRSMLIYSLGDQRAWYIMKHFAGVFKELGYDILFEGVESEELEDLCIDCDADYLQGYKFSKPMPVEDLWKYLER